MLRGELLRVLLSLLGIVGADLCRRLVEPTHATPPRRGRAAHPLRGDVSPSARANACVLLEADGKRLLIGMAPGGMRTLHVYDGAVAAPPVAVTAQPRWPMPAFGELLARWKRRA